MPAVVVPAVLSGVVAGSTMSAIGFSLGHFALTLAIGGLSRALAPKPKKPSFGQQVTSNTFAVRQPAEAHKHIYGHTRISDVYAHMVGTTNNEKLHAFLILCASEITAIDEVWVNDYVIPSDWIDEDGNVTQGRYANVLRIRKHLGNANQAADEVAIAELPEWTVDHRLRGIAYLYITMTKNADAYPTGLPSFSAVVRGKPLYDTRTQSTAFTTNVALFANDFLTNERYGFGTDDMDDTNVSAQANICDEFVTTADIAVDVDSIDTATDIITLDGDLNKFQWGDRVEVSGSVIPSGLSAATPYYVIIYQTKDTPRIKLAATLADCMANNAINITSSGTAVVITKTGEPRYHGAGVIETENELEDSLWSIVNAMAGRAIYTGGSWKLLAGAYRSPDIEFGTDDFIGGISTRTKIPLSERFNVIKGLYISSINNYQPDDYPAMRVQTYIDADNGVEYPRDLNLNFVNRPTAAQRIAKIELLKSRQEIVFTAPCSMKGFLAQVGDTQEITIDRYGWSAKEFEVTGFTFNVDEQQRLTTNLTFRETDSSVYDWTSAEDASIDPAPNTSLPSPFTVEVPTGVSFSSRAIDTRDGDVVYSLTLNWASHPNAFVREFGDFEIQYKLSSASDFEPSFSVDGALTSTSVLTSSVNVSYDLRIRARNNLGVKSNWVTITGAVAGSSGGVGATQDWGEWVSSPSASQDWGDWTSSPSVTDDWGYFT